uniref:Uncharacterized protein n=1 Tax=Pipistrellus kuhlii TaxID=59472 RepID=A0A7J7S502_PIPKU|nr:hypothetical protein mPipKuh1_010170 [Pipistrellus kuhlii]
MARQLSGSGSQRCEARGRSQLEGGFLGASGWSGEAAGEGGGGGGGGGGAGSLVLGPLTALGSRRPQPPSSLSSSSCICFGPMGGGGGTGTPGPLPRSALGGASLKSGRPAETSVAQRIERRPAD